MHNLSFFRSLPCYSGNLFNSFKDTMAFFQELVYGRKYDNSLRATCKGTAVAEAVLELEQVQAEWTKVLDLLKNEDIERKAAVQMQSDMDDGPGEQCELELLRKPRRNIQREAKTISRQSRTRLCELTAASLPSRRHWRG